MGSASSRQGCFHTAKTDRRIAPRHRQTRSLENFQCLHDREEGKNCEVAILTEEDFRGSNLKERFARQPGISYVRFGVTEKWGDQEEWIPTDNDLTQLTSLETLTALDVSGCREITRRGLTRFCLRPTKIKTLILNDCPKITNHFFDHIVHYCKLQRLHIRGCFRISDNGVEALKTLKHLRHLDISVWATSQALNDTQRDECPTITDESMVTLSQLTQLETLQMEGCIKISDEGLQLLATLRNLTCLNVSDTGLTDRGLKIFRHLPQLMSLSVGGCQISETAILQRLSSMPRLKHLNVARVDAVTDGFIQGLAKSCSCLTHLNISGCTRLAEKSFHHVGKITSLMHLSANGCTRIPGSSLKHLSSLLQLRVLHISGIDNVDICDVLSLELLQDLEISAACPENSQLNKLTALRDLTDLTLHQTDSTSREPALSIRFLSINSSTS